MTGSTDSGATGQGRVLGHRDQARPGAGAGKLPGVHPQSAHRCFLPRLRAAGAGGRQSAVSAVRDPQRAYTWRASCTTLARDAIMNSSDCTAWARSCMPKSSMPTKYARPCRVYAPVGSHEDLLPYLVRRLLENGANTSFVNRIVDESISMSSDIVADPIAASGSPRLSAAPAIFITGADMFADERRNSERYQFAGSQRHAKRCWRRCRQTRGKHRIRAHPIVGGKAMSGAKSPLAESGGYRRGRRCLRAGRRPSMWIPHLTLAAKGQLAWDSTSA